MCYKGKCFFCIPVEYGCLVFAVLSAISTLIVLLACIITGLLVATGFIVGLRDTRDTYAHKENDSSYKFTVDVYEGTDSNVVVSLIAGLPSLIAFIFSVLLCNGICKRRPGQVKAYFIYGVVITVLAVIAAVVESRDDPQLGLLGLVGCVLYSMILWMVLETHAKLRAGGAVFKDHISLVEQ